ncbi:MAG: nucleotide sugar dehydrogenase, partial [Myxococcales bacterium]|nr:nucleotide sugar dehydrogenase [Myxococcales bacterium]
MSPAFEFDVCILGAGRVGLPLGLALLDVGLSVVGVDLDGTLREAVNAGRMPFREPGFEALVAQRRLQVHATPEVAARSRAIVITVGTPLHTHIETDLRQIRRAIDGLLPHLREGQLICLRSTVAPGTTAVVRDQLERGTDLRVGETLGLAYCPERIAEGKAREELRTLPQIVGAQDALSANAAATLFARLAPEVLPCDWITAELVKLSNNIVRYVHFAVANQMALVADTFGADIHKVRALANHGYPRNLLASPGLTAGTCLRKDFGMISEWCPYPDLLLAAWKMNEAMPAFLVRHLEQRAPLRGARVAVLGYTFKRDTD